ncbi:putative electron transport complex protein RnfG [Azoarcus olearius]|uniref:RnfABCDGE type electron transport complex subunit G n=1 Tax=Azoarcus sp. (strain BH72) TaxID=418699 RepID=UPI0008060C83|nr:RnfABCDGE type electron transport complex subunit G [Azoarcus olearius]ANQ84605.1 putative electron transport complex protein RnfG [Azoarcus olearius]
MTTARYGAARTSLRTSAIMLVFTVVFTALMAFTYNATRPAIEASVQQAQLALVGEILPPGSYDNALLDDVLRPGAAAALGFDDARVWRARRGGEPVALVVEAEAPDGYAGRIGLIVAVAADGRLLGARVTRHKETPGLGDYVELAKDRNKHAPWIAQFAGLDAASLPLERWTVRKDGGAFDYRAGATISARAVSRAVGRAVDYVQHNRDALFAAQGGRNPGAGR